MRQCPSSGRFPEGGSLGQTLIICKCPRAFHFISYCLFAVVFPHRETSKHTVSKNAKFSKNSDLKFGRTRRIRTTDLCHVKADWLHQDTRGSISVSSGAPALSKLRLWSSWLSSVARCIDRSPGCILIASSGCCPPTFKSVDRSVV